MQYQILLDVEENETDLIELERTYEDRSKCSNCNNCCSTCCCVFLSLFALLSILGIICIITYVSFFVILPKSDNIYNPQTNICELFGVVSNIQNQNQTQNQTQTQKGIINYEELNKIWYGSFVTCYSLKYNIPLWTANRVPEPNMACERRPNTIMTNLYNTNTNYNTYTNSGFDRGHMTPAHDICNNQKISFDMINIAPQTPAFNRIIWKSYETWIRQHYGSKIVITIALTDWIGEKELFKNINGINILIPPGFCKIIIDDTYHVLWYGCIRQDETISDFALLKAQKLLIPPNHKKYPYNN